MPFSDETIRLLSQILSPQTFVLIVGLVLGVVIVRYVGAERKAAKEAPTGSDAKLLERIIRVEIEVRYLRRDVNAITGKKDPVDMGK